MLRHLIVAVATAALTVGTTSAPAHAARADARAQPTASVISVSKVYVVDGKPMVAATYRCTGRLSHLWVSAKQGRGDLTEEGSGARARSWYQRTWDNTKVICNGRQHTALFTMRPTGDTGRMRAGHRAYVQFCLLTANRRSGFEEGGNSSFASNMRYRQVHRL
jgi:hypothetical protein